jgi:ATP-dependent DNA helicase RecG
VEDTSPTLTGLLTLGKNPQDFIYGGYIQFLRIDGFQLGDPVVDELAALGRLTEMLKDINAKLTAHNRKAYDISQGPHRITEDYPLVAVHQLLYNAVQHRNYEGTNAPVRAYWYNDRIEITSPGGPYGEVSVENFGKPGFVDYRNPNLTVIMKNLGLIQRFGQGINTAREAMRQNGNPPIAFDATGGMVRCALRKKA